jgi:transposase
MTSKHVFKHLNQDLIELFDQAGHPDRVACVAIDYAKHMHKALICDGTGRSLKDPFDVENTTAGIEFLVAQIARRCNRFGIQPGHVVVGGEDCGSFSLNFVSALTRRGFLVIGVHAKTAKKQRENFQASTDKLDLLGIAKMIMDRRGTTRSLPVGDEQKLRALSRHRADLVTMKTSMRNRIHSLVDQIFPGFLDERLSGIAPFSDSSLWLMKDRFSPGHLQRRSLKVLVRELGKLGAKEPMEKARMLKEHAANAMRCPDELVSTLQCSLTNEIKLYEGILACIGQVDRESAKRLATTAGAMLTTIKGTGITLAAGVSSEIGPVESQPSLRRLTSYAGIVPRVKQSGGPESEAKHGTVGRQCNRILKNYVVQCGCHLGLHGPKDLREDHQRRTANGQHADFGLARRYLRIGMRLMRDNQAYLPEELRSNAEREELARYYLKIWPDLRKKWQRAGALQEAFAPENPLGCWRLAIQEIYDIRLPL